MEPVAFGLTLIDLAVVGGVALVLPSCLGGGWRWWALVAGSVAVACSLERGHVAAVLLALVWPVAVVAVGGPTVVRVLRGEPSGGRRVVPVLTVGYALVAAGALVVSRAGWAPFGFHEPIIQLTAVHFTFAGPAALVLASTAAASARTTATRRLGTAAIVLTAGAPPVVALGFFTHAALAQVGGAVLMSLGVFATAALHLERAVRGGAPSGTRLLLAVSGLAVWVPMVLAVAWAAAEHADVPALSIPDMVRTHGMGNAVGFVGAGLLAGHLQERRGAGSWS